ncbi:MAG: gamma carbonic anhydrase family protein [Pirellulales bacterium]
MANEKSASFVLPSPQIDRTAWVAPGAVVIGRVTLAAEASVWFNAVIRGDADDIVIGVRTNIQDGCVLHADPGFPCRIGANVTVGHNAIVHGATVEDRCLIGMAAVVMNGAVIGGGSIVGVGAVVTEGTIIPPRSLAIGIPAKVVRATNEEDAAGIDHAAQAYVDKLAQYRS